MVEWGTLPDAACEGLALLAAASPRDAAAFLVVDRRASSLALKVWAYVAETQFGTAVCAALRHSRPTWAPAPSLGELRNAAAGRLECCPAPTGAAPEHAARTGHAAALLWPSLLAVYGGMRFADRGAVGGAEAAGAWTAVADAAAFDVERARWLRVEELWDAVSAGPEARPGPRLRASLTTLAVVGSGEAVLLGGRNFRGGNLGRPYGDAWRVRCSADASGSTVDWHWAELHPGGSPPAARDGHAAVLAPCGLLVLGGIGEGGKVLPCEAYCLAGDEWRLPKQSGLFPPQGALHHGVCHGNRLLLVGGVDDVGLMRHGLGGMPTELHVLDLATWVWARLARQPLSPRLCTSAAAMVLCNRLFVVGGLEASWPAGARRQGDFVAVLDLERLLWMRGTVVGRPFAAAGHSIVGGILLGGLDQLDTQAPVAFLVPQAALRVSGDAAEPLAQPAPAGASPQQKVPRWFRR